MYLIQGGMDSDWTYQVETRCRFMGPRKILGHLSSPTMGKSASCPSSHFSHPLLAGPLAGFLSHRSSSQVPTENRMGGPLPKHRECDAHRPPSSFEVLDLEASFRDKLLSRSLARYRVRRKKRGYPTVYFYPSHNRHQIKVKPPPASHSLQDASRMAGQVRKYLERRLAVPFAGGKGGRYSPGGSYRQGVVPGLGRVD